MTPSHPSGQLPETRSAPRIAGLPAGVATPRTPQAGRLRIEWARHESDVRAAQRLRWRVFAEEMGARLRPLVGAPAGHDVDPFDAYCEHLLALVDQSETGRRVVGTYRVLMPNAARRLGTYFTESEFDLTRLRALRPRLAEFGRACIDAEWRRSPVLPMLWTALADFLRANATQAVIGCASVPMRDGGHLAAGLWHALRREHLAPVEHQVAPLVPAPVDGPLAHGPFEAPPLLRGYLRCGARLLGPPAWDAAFDCADLPLLLQVQDLPARYQRAR